MMTKRQVTLVAACIFLLLLAIFAAGFAVIYLTGVFLPVYCLIMILMWVLFIGMLSYFIHKVHEGNEFTQVNRRLVLLDSKLSTSTKCIREDVYGVYQELVAQNTACARKLEEALHMLQSIYDQMDGHFSVIEAKLPQEEIRTSVTGTGFTKPLPIARPDTAAEQPATPARAPKRTAAAGRSKRGAAHAAQTSSGEPIAASEPDLA